MSADLSLPEDLEIRSKLWIEKDGRVALSEWRVELLLAIEETGSLTGAAEQMNVPYRTAWYKLKDAEAQLGFPLVESVSGGAGGGGTRLTAQGRDIAARFQEAAREVAEVAQRRIQAVMEEASL
jgi:molybdate transport repressor ModE-like protein